MKYVASKLSYQQEFTFYAPAQGGGPAIRIGGITVKGGCNVRDEHTLVLPTDGVITEITDEDAARLSSHPVFKMYERNGAMKIVSSERDGRGARPVREGRVRAVEREGLPQEGPQAPEGRGAGQGRRRGTAGGRRISVFCRRPEHSEG